MSRFESDIFRLILDRDNVTGVDGTTIATEFNPTIVDKVVAYLGLLINALLLTILVSIDQRIRKEGTDEEEKPLPFNDIKYVTCIAISILLSRILLIDSKGNLLEYGPLDYSCSLVLSLFKIMILMALMPPTCSLIRGLVYRRNFVYLQKSQNQLCDVVFLLCSTFYLSMIIFCLYSKEHCVATNIIGTAFAFILVTSLSSHIEKLSIKCLIVAFYLSCDQFWGYWIDDLHELYSQLLDTPMKLMFPIDFFENGFHGTQYATLELGNIIVPGTLVAIFLRYDVSLRKRGYPPYFYSSLIGYLLGFLLTPFLTFVFDRPQPNLLYLVSMCVLLPISRAFLKGDLVKMFKYDGHEKYKRVPNPNHRITSEDLLFMRPFRRFPAMLKDLCASLRK